MDQCFVCGKHLQTCDINNEFSREDFASTVRKIIGDDYLLLFGEDDHLCRACQNLLLRIVRLEIEEKTNIHTMEVLLHMKYSLDFSKMQSNESCETPLQSDHNTELCFVCDKLLHNSDFNTDYSRNDLVLIIKNIIGDGYLVVIKEEDHLCQACQDLVLKIKSKGAELRTMTLAMRALLRIKYSLDFHNVGMLGSSLEDSSPFSQNRPVGSSQDLRPVSVKRSVVKVCQTKSSGKTNSVKGELSKKELTSSNITPSIVILTPGIAVLKKNKCASLKETKERFSVSSSKAVLRNSTQSSMSEDIEFDFSMDNIFVNENSPAAIPNFSQLKTEESSNQSSATCSQDDSHHENRLSESESINSESKTEISFYKLDPNKLETVPKPFKCSRCKFTYVTSDELEAHNLEMKSIEEYYCMICDFNFHLANVINQHNSHHSPVNLKLQCPLCHQSIYDRLHLRYHMYTIHKGEPFHKCSYCNRSFLWKRQLRRHLYKHHVEKPAFTCEKCSKVYSDKAKYMKHVEYFHRNSFSCKICLKSFKNIDSLCLHEKTHTKIITTYKCQYCFKSYRTLENRRLHEEQHSGNFEYKCSKCDLGFNDLVCFEKHKARNTCARTLYDYTQHPTLCEICGKIFSSRPSFRNHHLLHYNPQPFECDICNKKMRYKQKLVKHKKRYHSDSLVVCSENVSVVPLVSI